MLLVVVVVVVGGVVEVGDGFEVRWTEGKMEKFLVGWMRLLSLVVRYVHGFFVVRVRVKDMVDFVQGEGLGNEFG